MIAFFSNLFERKDGNLHGLDHLRAVAILLVALYHYGEQIPAVFLPLVRIGWSGVDLFFVLSGYLIGYQLMKEVRATGRIGFRTFFIKRFFRIIPPYLVVVAFYFTMPDAWVEGEGLRSIWRYLTFTQNLGLDIQLYKSFSHAWSLCIEEQFYLLLPVIIATVYGLRLHRRAGWLLLALFAGVIALRYLIWHHRVAPLEGANPLLMIYTFYNTIYYPTYTRLDGLLIGVSLAALFAARPRGLEKALQYGNLYLAAGLALFFYMLVFNNQLVSYETALAGFPLIAIAYGLMVLSALCPTSVLYRVPSRVTFIIATVSYAFYLVHKQAFYTVKTLLAPQGFSPDHALVLALAFLLAFAVSILFRIVIERPCLNLRHRILHEPS